ncbi:Rieske 2Fe-2S domain-containing protein [Arcicella rosea]|uniref:Nitrite reductase/ring-hydroxylating ferredoxin subunit n=1 Tax=Arcicella rosea TaxID=502909 RepID=A0A841EP28_9BACT|nr:Rieske 2Fe-2S domain-containing protein [Arcicella rosea]MBB6005522.1 nitrite reductase/ring-hydroxylating ferredoxin subunit [Arcicella rosea]
MNTTEEKMNRLTFLKQLGLSGASLMAVYCGVTMSSCTNEGDVVQPLPSGGITFDLSAAANAALKTKGGYVVDRTNNIVVAYTNVGTYVAVTLICSHEGQKQITYVTDKFYCTAHGATFDNTGKGTNSNGSAGLKTYTVTQSGTILTIS